MALAVLNRLPRQSRCLTQILHQPAAARGSIRIPVIKGRPTIGWQFTASQVNPVRHDAYALWLPEA
jgi:hypothetical protein